MRRLALHPLALVVALNGATVARAIELRVVDRHTTTESSPAMAPNAGCTTAAAAANDPRFTATSASLEARTSVYAAGSQCDANVQGIAQDGVVLTAIGAPGATAAACYVTHYEAATHADGAAATVSGDVGGSPYTTPGGVFLNGNPLDSFLVHFGPNQADSRTRRERFTVTVGDTIRLAVGSNSQGTLAGAGTVQASGKTFAAIYVGDCPRDRAPIASPAGLAGLALALAGLGALGARRRQRRG